MPDTSQNTGQFAKTIVTTAGKEMIAKSQNGQTLTFTRVALGDGLLDANDDPVNFTKLKSERLSANIAKFTDRGNGQFEVQFRVSNQAVETGFWHREIGVMAKIDEGEEQLYAYTTAGNKASFLYDKTTPIEERIVNMAFVIGNAQNVQVIVNSSIIYVTLEDMEESMATHNANADSHAEAFAKQFKIHNNDNTAHKDFTAPTNTTAGTRGFVPTPKAGEQDKFLSAGGWKEVPKMTVKDIIDIVHPVGDILITLDATNPGDRWQGTTWEQLPAGHTIVAAGNVETEAYSHNFVAGETGGEFVHQLSVGELPSHNHIGTISNADLNGYITYISSAENPSGVFELQSVWNTKIVATGYSDSWGKKVNFNATHNHIVNIDNTGGNKTHNNIQPYLTAYFWKRIN